MNESDKGKEVTHVPAQQAQQPQPSSALNSHVQFQPHGMPEENNTTISYKINMDQQGSGGSADGEPKNENPADIDEARFTAGVVKLYEALLKEPIPDEMLRLIDQLGQQERK